MSYWKTRGLRGSTFEELITMTNDNYMHRGLAVVQKIPTPITPTKIDNKTKRITQAFFEQKSTVDYIGAVQGIPICFDAKQTGRKMLPIQNIHEHQVDFMRAFKGQNGLSFLIVNFTQYDECYLLPFNVLDEYYKGAKKGGRKSIPYSAFEKKYLIKNKNGFYIHYLEAVNVLLNQEGDENEEE